MRESALAAARTKLQKAQDDVIAEKTRLESKPGLLQNLTPKAKQERELSINTMQNNLQHYDSQLKQAESLTTLIQKDILRWLECCLKTSAPDYAAALATHDYHEDWTRFSYGFDMLIKSFHMGLQDVMAVFRRENANGGRSQLLMDSIQKLLPIARLIEIDVEFFNRVLVQQGKQKRATGGKVTLHPEYSWCETVEQLGTLPEKDALETLGELITANTGFLANLSQVIRREKFQAETKVAQKGKTTESKPSFLKTWQEGLRPAALELVDMEKLGGIITETESLLMDGEFTVRFNRYMVKTIVVAPPPVAAEKPASVTTAPFVQNDTELRALKTKLQAELEEVAKLKAGLASRERTLKEHEQKLRENEHAFTEKCKREQAVLEEAKATLVELEESISLRDREAEEKRAAQLAELEGKMAELAARSVFMDESELRLLEKGQEQLERLAELEQKEEDLMATKRELNAMRKEMGLPMIALRAKPVDEFEE